MKRKNVIQLLTEHTSAREREISELPVPSLLHKLQQGDISASEVLVRYDREHVPLNQALSLCRPRSRIALRFRINW